MPVKPTTPYGHIAFGKDGSVRRNIKLLSKDKLEQEMAVGKALIELGSHLWEGTASVRKLDERDHDFSLVINEQPRISVECSEVVYRDFLASPDAQNREMVLLDGKLHPVDLEKRDNVLRQKVELKLDKHYSKPSSLQLWLLIWSVTGYSHFGAFWKGGRRIFPAPVIRVRELIEERGPGPSDSTLLGDGVRVLTRIMRKITKLAGATGGKLRDRSRSVTTPPVFARLVIRHLPHPVVQPLR